MENYKIFIHVNHKQKFAAKVAAYSFKKLLGEFPAEVEFIELQDYPDLYDRDGQTYLRKGVKVEWINDDLQSFTPLRFLPPQIMGYKGRALVVDPDVFAIKDLTSLLTMDMKGKSIFVRKIERDPPIFATSVMLLDCEKLKHWDWSNWIERLFNFEIDYRDWMSLHLEEPSSIGILEDHWNHYDLLNEKTCLLHTTQRNTQPWKTGLPIDFHYDAHYIDEKGGSLGGKVAVAKRHLRIQVKRLLSYFNSNIKREDVYIPHPDINQEKLFLNLLNQLLAKGLVQVEEIKEEMKMNHLRHDLLKLVALP